MSLSKRDQILSVVKKIQMQGLLELDRICRKHDIKYSLSGGTLLGAIRHGGYIPWDDDLDIEMDRTEFDRLYEVCKTELDHEKFTLRCHENDPTYYSYTPRLMINNTVMNTKSMEATGQEQCIFIDIFLHDFLPNDPVKRQEYLDKIYMTKVLTYFKKDGVTVKIPRKDQAEAWKFVESHDYDYFLSEFEKYAKHYYNKGEKTDYIIDTAIVHNNYGGFPYSIKDGFFDVKFEDYVFRSMEGYDRYFTNLYGPDYMTIYPKYKRISHHKWKRVDLGPYAEKYGVKPDDIKYMLMNLNADRLKQVKQVSFDMLDVIDEICRKHSITYYLCGNDALYKANGTDEYANIWRDDITVLMDKENLDRFIEKAPGELTHYYFLEHSGNSEDYWFPYAKLKLNYTYFRDRRTTPAEVNNGLWINIGLLVNTSNNLKEREQHYEDLAKVYDQIRLNWLYSDVRARKFIENDQPERYADWEEAMKYSLEELLERQKKLMEKYDKKRFGKYCLEATTSLVRCKGIPKKALGKGTRLDYHGHSYVFPKSPEAYMKAVVADDESLDKHLKQVKRLKNKKRERYDFLCENMTEKQEEKMNKKVSYAELGMYDAKEYRSGAFDMDIVPLKEPIRAEYTGNKPVE